jgi:hypothetical protein
MKFYDYVTRNEIFYSKLVEIKNYYDFIDSNENRLEIGNFLLNKFQDNDKLKNIVKRFKDEFNLIKTNKDEFSYDFLKFKEIFDKKIKKDEILSFSILYKIYIQLLLLDLSKYLEKEGCGNPSIKCAYRINDNKKIFYMKNDYFTFDIVKPDLNSYKEVLKVEDLYMKIIRNNIDKISSM